MPCLVWESPEGRVVHDLDRAVLVIGRDTVSDIVVLEPAVSRRHALVQVDGDSVTVTDLGSSSGTRINGAKLTPDLPSSLQVNDIIQIGRVVLTYHVAPPPPAPLRLDTDTIAPAPKSARATAPVVRSSPPPRVSPPPRTPPRTDPRRSDAVAPGGPPWKWIAFGAAFLTVGMAGALTAVVMGRSDKVVERPVTVLRSKVESDPGVVAPEPKTEPKTERESVPEATTEKEPERDVTRAPDGELPPRGFVSVTDFPDLIEMNGDRHYPVSIVTFNGSRVEAVGADGRTYLIRQADVTKSEDRADLARRAARARQQLDPDDADAQLELARWCFRRYIRRETRLLAKRVLELRPGDAEATELLRMTE